MIYELTTSDHKLVRKLHAECIQELNEFFGINFSKYPPPVVLVQSVEEMRNIRARELEPWVEGCALYSVVFVLHPDRYEKEGTHEYSLERYRALLKHELCHVYYQQLCTSGKPIWLNEGVCGFVSSQTALKPKPTSFSLFLRFSEKHGRELYGESCFAVELLVNAFGKEKLLSLIRKTNNVRCDDDFRELFEDEYEMELTHDSFNALLQRDGLK